MAKEEQSKALIRKITTIGNSTAVVITKEMLKQIGVQKGDYVAVKFVNLEGKKFIKIWKHEVKDE